MTRASVATTQIYTESDMAGAHLRLAPLATLADDLRGHLNADIEGAAS